MRTTEHSTSDQMALPSQEKFIDTLQPLPPSALLALTDNCAICMDDEVTDAIKLNCKGQHIFCSKCVLTWFQTSASCPMCREVLYHREVEEDEDDELSGAEEDAEDEPYVLELVNDILTFSRPNFILDQQTVLEAARHYIWFSQPEIRRSYRSQRRELDDRRLTVEGQLGLAAIIAGFALFKNLPPDTTRRQWAEVTERVYGIIRSLDGLTMTAGELFTALNRAAQRMVEDFEQRRAYQQVTRNMLHFIVSYAHWQCHAEE